MSATSVAVCCDVLQCVSVCCIVLQCIAACCSGVGGVEMHERLSNGGSRSITECLFLVWHCVVVRCSVLCCSFLRCVVACCSVLQCVSVCCNCENWAEMYKGIV